MHLTMIGFMPEMAAAHPRSQPVHSKLIVSNPGNFHGLIINSH
jgi:hypothetical protein